MASLQYLAQDVVKIVHVAQEDLISFEDFYEALIVCHHSSQTV